MSMTDLINEQTALVEESNSILKLLSDKTGLYVWKQLTAEGGDFVDYVVADAEDAYPDGGTQDGYYYKKITSYSGDNPLTIGEDGATIAAGTLLDAALKIVNGVEAGIPLPGCFTKYSVQTFTPSSYINGNTVVNHNLGVIPKVIMAFASNLTTTDFDLYHYYMEDWLQSGYQVGHLLYYYWYNGIERNDNIAFTTTATTVKFGAVSPYYAKGVTYTIIAFA